MDVIMHPPENVATGEPLAEMPTALVRAFADAPARGSSIRTQAGILEMVGTELVLLARTAGSSGGRLRITEDLGPTNRDLLLEDVRKRAIWWTTVLEAARPDPTVYETISRKRGALVMNALDAHHHFYWHDAFIHPGTVLVAPRIRVRLRQGLGTSAQAGQPVDCAFMTDEIRAALTDETTVHVSGYLNGNRINFRIGAAPCFLVQHGGPVATLHRHAAANGTT